MLIDRIKKHPKAFHSYTRSKKVCNPIVGPLGSTDELVITNCATQSEIFASELLQSGEIHCLSCRTITVAFRVILVAYKFHLTV